MKTKIQKLPQILSPDQIEISKWNDCVLGHENGTVFGSFEYLSHMADDWSGLVIDDYAAVLPLLYKKKWRIRYLAGIPFVRQLGLMGEYNTGLETLLPLIHDFCSYGDIAFNHNNADLMASIAIARPNFTLDLNLEYATLRAGYRKSLRRKFKKDGAEGFQLQDAVIEEVLDAYAHFLKQKVKEDLSIDFGRLKAFFLTHRAQKHFFPYKIMDQNGSLLMLGIYVKDTFKVYNFMSVQVQAGRDKNAMAVAVDRLIQQFSGQNLLFDFMGSALPGVQEFIHGFGAREQAYYLYHFNHLPWPLNKLKR